MTGAPSRTPPRPGRLVPYVLAACTAVSILSTDLITPSIPDLPEALGTDITAAQLTVSVNLTAYALAQLVHGPVADAIGRRRLLLFAFTAFAIVSALTAMAASIEWLLAGRFLQGLLSSVPSVVIVLIIRELYDPQRALKVMALYGATLGIAPAFGPLMGGYLHSWYGWQAGFWLIAALAIVVMLALARMVPESLREPRPLRLGSSLAGYATLFRNRAYLRRCLGVSALFSAYFAYVTSAPVVLIDLMEIPAHRYGLSHVVIIVAYILGSLTASRLSNKVPPGPLLRLAALGMALAMLGLLVPILLGVLALPAILAPMALYGFCLAFVLAAGPLVVLDAVRGSGPQGPAAALLGSLQLGLAAAAGYLCATLYDGTAQPLVLVMSVVVLVGVVCLARLPGEPMEEG